MTGRFSMPSPGKWRGGRIKPLPWNASRIDLVRDLGGLNPADFDGIVSTALFDLVSADWAKRFTAWLAQAPRPVLLTLSVDGRLDWTPGDPADAAMRGWIEAHQATDKGFGPALGPHAPALLAELLQGSRVRCVHRRE